ncbi:MAG TPA: hypothetical protein VKQ30_18525 [Ktedonobacterales bacterium]|nr:hypothetical protein [Ktedonobacterales bacterium]
MRWRSQPVWCRIPGREHYFRFYNYERPHQALDYRTPAQVYDVAA